jgi:hypothetical protein
VVASAGGGMPMARRRRFPDITGDEAISALRWLVARRQLKVGQIEEALKRRERLVREIRHQLEGLNGEGLRLFRGPVPAPERGRPRRPRKKPSAAQQAAWKRQGRYLAAVRRLPKAARAKVRTIREKRGVRAAIAAARKLSVT